MSSLSPGVVSRESGEKRNFDKTHRILAGLELVVCQIVLNIFIILCIRVPTQLPQSLRVWSQEIEQWNLILSLGQDRTISSWVHPLPTFQARDSSSWSLSSALRQLNLHRISDFVFDPVEECPDIPTQTFFMKSNHLPSDNISQDFYETIFIKPSNISDVSVTRLLQRIIFRISQIVIDIAISLQFSYFLFCWHLIIFYDFHVQQPQHMFMCIFTQFLTNFTKNVQC